MFGTTIETFRASRILTSILALITLSVIVAFALENHTDSLDIIIFALIIIPLIFIIFWLWSVEIKIYNDGISSKTILGKQEIRWEDVSRLTYSATKQSVNFIPVGTYYDMKLENMQGQKIHIGNRVNGMQSLSTHIINYTQAPLYNKIVNQFNSGSDLDFGAIKLNRNNGFKAKGLFRTITVPLNQVIGYRIEKGQFHIFKQGKKYAAISAPISKAPNAFALLALLDALYKRDAKSS